MLSSHINKLLLDKKIGSTISQNFFIPKTNNKENLICKLWETKKKMRLKTFNKKNQFIETNT